MNFDRLFRKILFGIHMLKLSIIGCGNVAKTMAFLWHQSNSVEVVDVVNRSQCSADNSVTFIGAGNALSSVSELREADIFVIGCADDQIESCLEQLLKQNIIKSNNIIFHFSGAKNSSILDNSKNLGAKCASLHPVKSFASPASAINTFIDTYCGLEGDEDALIVLEKLIKNIGGHCFKVNSDKKLTYHAASIFSCNYMVALQELSIRAFAQSGVERELAMKIVEPIVKETIENIFQMGMPKALTGPIARGDHKLVAEQLSAINDWDEDAGDIYRLLGKISADLSDTKGVSDKTNLANIKTLFEKEKPKPRL